MLEVDIRQATGSDVTRCHQIESVCFEPSEAAPRSSIEKRQRLYPQGFIVAERRGHIVGFINSGATEEEDLSNEEFKAMVGHDDNGRNIVIFSVAVDPEFQKTGVCRQLLARFCDNAKMLRKNAILLLCKSDLITLYGKFGFIDLGESASTHGGFRWHAMRRVLT